jgi:ABC-type nitrate/sulfonate/bicarbonate transport system substrate-binding protein
MTRFSILLKAAGAESVKINWVAVQPQLFRPDAQARRRRRHRRLYQTRNIPAALELGLTLRRSLRDQVLGTFGADMYGLALVTPKKFADENPQTVRAVVKALTRVPRTRSHPRKRPWRFSRASIR